MGVWCLVWEGARPSYDRVARQKAARGCLTSILHAAIGRVLTNYDGLLRHGVLVRGTLHWPRDNGTLSRGVGAFSTIHLDQLVEAQRKMGTVHFHRVALFQHPGGCRG